MENTVSNTRQKQPRSLLDPAVHQCFEALFEKERTSLLGAFVQGLIHNLNGPLQNISMLTELVAASRRQFSERMADSDVKVAADWKAVFDREQELLQKLTGQVSIMDDLLRELRLLNEIERGSGEVDLNLVMRKLVQVFRCDLFFKHEVHLQLELADQLPLLQIRGRHLVPALSHVLKNAVMAVRVSSPKEVTIATRVDQGRVVMTISDSGCGIRPGEEESCFGPFYSAWPAEVLESIKSESPLGIGLFLARAVLAPYGIKMNLRRNGTRTLAILDIPVQQSCAARPSDLCNAFTAK
jgi:signal transduction histidine kinase